LTGAADGTVLRLAPDRRGLAFVAIYAAAALVLAAGALGLGAVVRWPLAAICLLVAGGTAASLLRRAARTEVTPDGLVLRHPPRRPDRYPWPDVEGFEAVDGSIGPVSSSRSVKRVAPSWG
jgi:hypothetical protein